MKISKELLKGSTVTLVLSLLSTRSMYGYEMIQVIKTKSNGIFNFNEGTLYPILHSLESGELIESYWMDSETGRKRKYYKLTDKGRVTMEEKKEEWSLFSRTINMVLMEA